MTRYTDHYPSGKPYTACGEPHPTHPNELGRRCSRPVHPEGTEHGNGLGNRWAPQWTGDGLTFRAEDSRNPLTGGPMGPARGTVPGARIDAAVAEALAEFWRAFSDRFPEATAGDMAPGDTDRLEEAAADAGRVWVMWNVPGGMPE